MVKIIGIKLIESSPTEPVTLAEAKTKLRITDSDNDAEITDLISVARKEVERMANISIVEKTVEMIFDAGDEKVILPYAPVTDVTSLTWYDSANEALALVENDDYYQDLHEVKSNYNGKHKVVYATGYEEVPHDIKDAVLNVIAIRYQHRGDALNEGQVKEAIKELVKPFWIPWI